MKFEVYSPLLHAVPLHALRFNCATCGRSLLVERFGNHHENVVLRFLCPCLSAATRVAA